MQQGEEEHKNTGSESTDAVQLPQYEIEKHQIDLSQFDDSEGYCYINGKDFAGWRVMEKITYLVNGQLKTEQLNLMEMWW